MIRRTHRAARSLCVMLMLVLTGGYACVPPASAAIVSASDADAGSREPEVPPTPHERDEAAGQLQEALHALERLAVTRVTIREDDVSVEGVMRVLESVAGIVITPDPRWRGEEVLGTRITLHVEQMPALMILDHLLASVQRNAVDDEVYDFLAVGSRMVLVERSASETHEARHYARFYPWSAFDPHTQAVAARAGGEMRKDAASDELNRTPLRETDIESARIWYALENILDVPTYELHGMNWGGHLYSLDFLRGGVQLRTHARMHRAFEQHLAATGGAHTRSLLVESVVFEAARDLISSVLTGPSVSVADIEALRALSNEWWSAQSSVAPGGVYRASVEPAEEVRFHLTLSPEQADAAGRWGVPLHLTSQVRGANSSHEVRAVLTGEEGVVLLELPAVDPAGVGDRERSALIFAVTLRIER